MLQRIARAAYTILILAGLLLVGGPAYAEVTSTRESAADWLCCDDAACTKATQHQRQDTAIVACVNKAADGKPRWVQGGRYRITATAAAPQPAPGAQLSWTVPLRNTDGTTITGALSYRVEQQAGTSWTPLATVTGTSYTASAPTGCWRVVAIAGGSESQPTTPACKT